MVTLDWVNELGNDIGQNMDAQISYFERQGRPDIADIFRSLKNQRDWQLQEFQNDLIDQFATVADTINPTFEDFLSSSENIYNRVIPEIRQNRQLVEEKFWPWGEMQRNIDSYYNNLINAINNEVSGWINMAQWQAQRAWASRSAINQAIQEARQSGMKSIAQAEAEKLSQQQNLLRNLLELRQWISDRQFDRENALIRQPILDIGEQIQNLSTWLLSGLQNISGAWLEYLAQSGQLGNIEQLLWNRVEQPQQQQEQVEPQVTPRGWTNSEEKTAVQRYIEQARSNNQNLGRNQSNNNQPPTLYEQDLQDMWREWASQFLRQYRDTYWIQSKDEMRNLIQPWRSQDNNIRSQIAQRNRGTSQPNSQTPVQRYIQQGWRNESNSWKNSSLLETIRRRNLWI